jgi:hypothetical protein
MLVLIANKVTFWLAYQFYAIASIQTHSGTQLT